MANANLKIWRGTTLMFSGADSGTLQAGDRIRFTDIMYGPLALCYGVQPPRGAFGTNSFNGMGINRAGWVVNQSTVTNVRGGVGKLVIEWEAGGAQAYMALPVGSWRLEKNELYPKIERNAYFAGMTSQTANLAYNSIFISTDGSGNPIVQSSTWLADKIKDGSLGYNSTTAPVQLAFANALAAKLARGEETFYLTGWRYSYEIYSYTEPATSGGGIIVNHPGGPLANLPANMSWMSLCDDMESVGVNGSMYKLTKNFIGGPIYQGIGYWDPDLYPAY